MIHVRLEDDPVPLVSLVAHQLKLALQQEASEAIMRKLDGTLVMHSMAQDQFIHLQLTGDTIRLGHAAPTGSRGILGYRNLYNCDHLHDPRTIDCKKDGDSWFIKQWRQAVEISDQDWHSGAVDFWRICCERPYCPTGLELICTESAESLTLGDPDSMLSMRGNAQALTAILTGRRPLLPSVIRRQISFIGSFRDFSVLGGVINGLRMGELS